MQGIVGFSCGADWRTFRFVHCIDRFVAVSDPLQNTLHGRDADEYGGEEEGLTQHAVYRSAVGLRSVSLASWCMLQLVLVGSSLQKQWLPVVKLSRGCLVRADIVQ